METPEYNTDARETGKEEPRQARPAAIKPADEAAAAKAVSEWKYYQDRTKAEEQEGAE